MMLNARQAIQLCWSLREPEPLRQGHPAPPECRPCWSRSVGCFAARVGAAGRNGARLAASPQQSLWSSQAVAYPALFHQLQLQFSTRNSYRVSAEGWSRQVGCRRTVPGPWSRASLLGAGTAASSPKLVIPASQEICQRGLSWLKVPR